MKAFNKFLSLFAIVAMSITMVSCSDNDEPTQNNWHKNGDTIVYIDNRSGEMPWGVGFLMFERECFRGYYTEVTIDYKSGIQYNIYIPNEGCEIELLEPETRCFEMRGIVVNGTSVLSVSNIEDLGQIDMSVGTHFVSNFYRVSNEYLTVTFDELHKLKFNITPNNLKKERRIEVAVTDGLPSAGAGIIFIQEGKK